LQEFDGGHDWSHTERVLNLAVKIREAEKDGDLLIIKLAAILHDIADTKFHSGKDEDGGDMAFEFLSDHGLEASKAEHVRNIINRMSFKHLSDSEHEESIEFQIVQDADRLDALGAIGIARAFNYGGYKNRSLYDPSIPPVRHSNTEAYKKSTAPTINHFYEKLFLLKDLMNTPSAKKMADERHSYMVEFVERFKAEWEQ
jgi:uncharacterized protein